MRKVFHLSVVFLSIIVPPVVAVPLIAQESQRVGEAEDTIRVHIPTNSTSILFDRNVNTLNWTGRALLDTTTAGYRVSLSELYTSNIIIVEGANPAQRLQSNQQRGSLVLGKPVSENLSMQTEWTNLIYSDNKSVGLSNASTHSVYGGLEYTPLPAVSLSPLIGYRWENQLGIRDNGLSYTLDARTNALSFDGYDVRGYGQFHEDRIDPRRLEDHFARVDVQKTFEGATRDSFLIGFNRNRREFYSLGDNSIESRIEHVFVFTNLIDYELQHNFITSFFVNVVSRGLDKDVRHIASIQPAPLRFNTGIDEFRLDAYLQSTYHTEDGRTAASVRLYHSERDERHFAKQFSGPLPDSIQLLFTGENRNEQRKDNLSRRTSLSGSLSFPFSFSDQVRISGAASIFRYDTPSTLNVEDRDELLIAASLLTRHRLSQYLELSLALEGNLSHVVYLLQERSANNNFNRVLRFSPTVMYVPVRPVATINSFEVLANYTVYDFEDQVLQARSFSYRQFGWIDSTSVELTNRIGLDFFVYLKLYERGQLNWNEFAERRENSFVDKTYAVQLRFVPHENLFFGVGLRYFSQTRYGYSTGEKKLESFLRSIGPTCNIIWQVGRFSRLSLKGWYEQRHLNNGVTRPYTNMTMNILITL